MEKHRWHVQSLGRSLAGAAPEWDALNRRLQAGHPMMDSRYVDALLRHFGDGSEYLCCWEKCGNPAGMVILKPGRPGIWTSFVPAHSPGFPLAPMVLKDAPALGALPAALPGWSGQVDILCHDPLLLPLPPGPDSAGPTLLHSLPYALTMAVRLEGDFETYWQQRSANLRGALRQRLNRLAKAGLEPRLVRLEAPGEMAGAVERYAALELSGWKGREGSAVAPGNAKGRFYREILEKFAETGQAAVYEYWLGEHLAAAQLVISGGPMAIYLKTAYDEEFSHFSPGLLLLRELLRDSFHRHPGGVFEFYTNTGNRPLQLAWATDQRWIGHVTFYRNPAVQRVSSALRTAKGLASRVASRLRPAPGSSPATS